MYNQMLRNQLLSQIDTTLKEYVSANNSNYNSTINTIFMNKSQLTNFYNEMGKNFKPHENLNNSKSIEKAGKIHKKNKSLSVISKENKIFHWKLANKITMNQKALISNCESKKSEKQNNQNKILGVRHHRKNSNKAANTLKVIKQETRPKSSYIKSYKIPTIQWLQFGQQDIKNNDLLFKYYRQIQQSEHAKPKLKQKNQITDQQYDKEQIRLFKKLEEQKYINRHLLKLKKKQIEEQKIIEVEDLQAFQIEDKKNRKLNACFEKVIQNFSSVNIRQDSKQIQAIRDQKTRKAQISNAIKTYFLKKNRYCPLF